MKSRVRPPHFTGYEFSKWEPVFDILDRALLYVICCICIGVVLFECAQQVGH